MALISFAIPVFQNEGALTLSHEKIVSLFKNKLKKYEYEIIFVDDGSSDNSLNELLELREKDKCVKVVSFTRNFGQMAAILAGLQYATGDVVINVSADLQDPIELVEQMVEHWESGSEIVVCHRIEREDKPSAKFVSKIAYGLLKLSVPQLPSGGFDFVLIDRKVVDFFNSIEGRNRFFQGDLLWGGYKVSYIPYARLKRTIGKSQYNFWKKLKNFADAILDASYLPIRLISGIGVLTSLAGFIYLITVVISWFFSKTPFEGWAPIMVAIMIIGGLIMLMLGIIGEYIWRIYDQVRDKPNYIVRDEYLT